MNIKNIFFIMLNLCFFSLKAQTIITPQKAVSLALERNYGIKVAENNVEVAENNAHILNSNYLPSFSASTDAYYNVDDAEANFKDGNQAVLKGAKSSSYSASVDFSYTIFDGTGRWYNYKKLKETKGLTELQTRETIENTILQLFTVYYTLAETIENKNTISKTLKISQERLVRANYQFEYGQNTKLAILNAEVDVNNDTINLININQQIRSYKRDLNLVLGNALLNDFNIDTVTEFNTLYNKNELLEKAKVNNVQFLQTEKNELISKLDLKNSQSAFLPTVGLLGSYGWNKNNNNDASVVSSSVNTGFTGGLTLSWDLFSGGTNVTNIKNSKLAIDSQKILKQELEVTLERDFNNAWDDFQNKLSVYKLQEKNIKTTEDNFKRTEDKFKLGQVNSIDFRQAQLNLLNAEIGKNKAKYQAKLAELVMLQICGEILNVRF